MKNSYLYSYIDKIEEAAKQLKIQGIITVDDITIQLNDIIISNIIKEWVEGWLKKNGIDYALNDNTQMPPDFYLNPDNKTEELMEIKAFNYKAGPGFDISDCLTLKKVDS